MQADDIRDEVQAEFAALLHQDERATKTLDSNTLRAPISELKIRPMLEVPPEATVAEAVHAMVSHRQGCVLVTENDRLLGIFTERDILTRVVGEERDPKNTLVRDVMSPDPETLNTDEMIAFAMNFMDVGGYRHVPLVDHDGNLEGVVSVRDVLRYLAEFFPEEVLTVPPRPNPYHPLYGG